jgi:hypothetical protein
MGSNQSRPSAPGALATNPSAHHFLIRAKIFSVLHSLPPYNQDLNSFARISFSHVGSIPFSNFYPLFFINPSRCKFHTPCARVQSARRGQQLTDVVCRHSVRRAALRAASSSSSMMATASRQQAISFAMQFSKASVRPAAAISARFFSVTRRVAQDEKVLEELIEPAESTGAAEEGSTLESSPTEKARAGEGHSIFVSNMTFDATDVHLQEAFGKYGELVSVRIGRDGRGLSRGYALLWTNFNFCNII